MLILLRCICDCYCGRRSNARTTGSVDLSGTVGGSAVAPSEARCGLADCAAGIGSCPIGLPFGYVLRKRFSSTGKKRWILTFFEVVWLSVVCFLLSVIPNEAVMNRRYVFLGLAALILRGQNASIPSELVGFWSSSEVRSIMFSDRSSTAFSCPTGATIKYQINPTERIVKMLCFRGRCTTAPTSSLQRRRALYMRKDQSLFSLQKEAPFAALTTAMPHLITSSSFPKGSAS